ncbi:MULTISPECIES: hypothetical protein [unclassified Streptomyces]|uniref:hypothetical protein n=1 Tax=unclassified Streptomyces TaxID=2593676 RepID=UPI0033B2117D|nr:hypothetical protein OG199_03575 [Streptomyces sp. NBC_01176]
MDGVEVPWRTFDHLLTGFIRNEAADVAIYRVEGESANPGDAFGNVFAWLWEREKDSAVTAFAGLLAEARKQSDEGDEVRLEELIKGLRLALHRSRLGQKDEFHEVERILRDQVPGHFGGRTDL